MKKLHIFTICVFLLSLATYGFFFVKHSRADDSIPPRIGMEADTVEVSVADDEEAILQGITASDSNDGDVSDTLIVESMGQFIEKGRRKVTIAAFDSSSNVSKVTREVLYTDYVSPRFQLTEPLRFPVNEGDVMENLYATDVLDGDITQQIKVTDSNVDPEVAANYKVTFSVTNTAGDSVQLPCTVTIYDNSSSYGTPVIELSDYLIYVPAGYDLNPWNYVTAITRGNTRYERAEDGILYSQDGANTISKADVSIKGTKDMDINTPGVYEYTYKITDFNNRTGSVRLIVVVE